MDSATIVVVERDPAAQDLIDQALRAHGHRVLVTGDTQEALNLAQRVRIDVLVVDAELFRERVALVDRLRALQPELPLVRIGNPNGTDVSGLDGEIGVPTPFSLADLESAVALAVARTSRE